MRRRGAALRGCRSAVAAGLTVLVAGCATGLESLPLPAPDGAGGDRISLTAVFSNALNLPAKAKVKLNGADIGDVDSIRAQDFAAYVTMRINPGVPLRAGATAELRSATPLGDVFVAIKPNPQAAADAPLLRDGDTIAMNSTSAAATIEDVLSSATLLINGGAIRRLVTIVNGAGSAVGGRGEKLAALLQHSNTLISRLNARSAQIDGALRSTSDLAAALSARQDTLNEAIAAAGPGITAIHDNTGQLADLVDAVARVTSQLNRFPSMKGTDTRSLIADLNRLSATFNDISLDPALQLNRFNWLNELWISAAKGPNLAAVGDIAQLALGSLPDMNWPGDPAFHGPDGTDWHAMIGSLRYEWNLLLGKIYGPEHLPR
ncbi:MAG: phospholipid/cholesterol/gamma-HCH transport system substrate-binding protein [Mycobacterium sp.]|jgi:virulence factor Mce-like protein|nr:phospholipid/cholesterol/gamma-HCH transport system substrate-binding protein [Mycobacterium sp.]